MYPHVLNKKVKGADLVVEEEDDIRVEEQASYRRRAGKWSRDALRVIKDDDFWAVMNISRIVHTVTQQIQNLCNMHNPTKRSQAAK